MTIIHGYHFKCAFRLQHSLKKSPLHKQTFFFVKKLLVESFKNILMNKIGHMFTNFIFLISNHTGFSKNIIISKL